MTINVTRDAIFLLSTSSNLEGRPGENTLSQNMAADAAKKNEEESDKDSKRGDAPVKLSHKQFRRLVKKERRRKKRQQAAKKREQEELEEKWRIDNDPVLRAKIEAKERKDKKRLLEEEEERKTQHRLWLEREAIAQERFRKKKEDEERKIQEKEEQEERIKREWEQEQRREKEKEEQKQKAIKEKEDALFKELDKPSTSKNSEAWHNPLAPPAPGKSYGTEQDTVNCSFYLKTGACRFGERCSRQHPRPSSSLTLMIPAMYNDIRLSQSMLDEADQDTSLEYDDKEAYENFKQFYEDTLPEFRKAGSVVQFKVCCNHEPHLRGNVYVQFASEEGCAKAFAMFNARWYASKQLSCEFSPVTKWKSAICGLFERNRCPRGKNCNFLHVYRNPGNEFNHREELSPGHTPYNGRGSERSERSDRDRRRDQRSRYRELDRDISRNRDWTVKEYRKRRKREWSRERDDSYYRHRRWSEEKDHNRGKHEEQDKRLRKDCTSDEGDEGENEDKHLSERLAANVNESEDTVAGNEKHWHSYDSKDKTKKKKRRHHSSEKHIHRRKSQKRHKHHSERKKKKHRSRSRSESSSSESGSD